MSQTAARADPFRPATRVAGQRQDVWYAKKYFNSYGLWAVSDCFLLVSRSIVNEAAAASPVQPIVNMGQGFL